MTISADDLFAETMTPEMLAASDRRAAELLEEFTSVRALRKARRMTQGAVATGMGNNQVAVAQMERRQDVLLSSLRSYIEALGGELEIIVRFPDRPPARLAGIGERDKPDRG